MKTFFTVILLILLSLNLGSKIKNLKSAYNSYLEMDMKTELINEKVTENSLKHKIIKTCLDGSTICIPEPEITENIQNAESK